MIKAVLFDLDNTLIDRDGAFERLLQDECSDPAKRHELRLLDAGGHGDRQLLFQAWNQYRTINDKMLELSQDILATKIAEQLSPNRPLLDLLSQLKSTVSVAILTNGGSQTQRLKISAARLDQVIQASHQLVSGELGMAKPDPQIFRLACKRIKADPKQTLYLGDQSDIDGIGARAAGLQFQLVQAPLSADTLRQILIKWRIW